MFTSVVPSRDAADDWNAQYQRALTMPRRSTRESIARFEALARINSEFLLTAETIAMTLISELFLPDGMKSIPQARVGGQAGGTKFEWRGILFKLATGRLGPYADDDEAAAKALKHDLRGVNSLHAAHVPGLFFALHAVIDFKGWRMLAQSRLPIDGTTLAVGSADGGVTVLARDATLLRKMRFAASALNVASHRVRGVTLHSAADVEGHLGRDGRHYLIDCSRALPPEHPAGAPHLATSPHAAIQPGAIVHARGAAATAAPLRAIALRVGDDGVEVRPFGARATVTLARERVAADVRHCRAQSIFWRLLRPDFVKTRGRRIVLQERRRAAARSAAACEA